MEQWSLLRYILSPKKSYNPPDTTGIWCAAKYRIPEAPATFWSAKHGLAFITCAGFVSRSQHVLEDPFSIWGRNADKDYHPTLLFELRYAMSFLCSPWT